MKDRIYLIISENRVERMTKNPPGLAANEIFIQLDFDILPIIFKRPTFQGQINVVENEGKYELIIKEIEQGIKKLKKGKENAH
jgi:hypothetical protein